MKNKILVLLTAFIIITVYCFIPIRIYADTEEKKLIYETSFEESFDGWSPLGNQSSLSIDSKYSKEGAKSLRVSEREADWSGPSLTTSNILKPGETYFLSAAVRQEQNAVERDIISWTIFITGQAGSPQYECLCSGEVIGSWTVFECEYTMPEDVVASNIYFEASTTETNFNIDNVKIYGYNKRETPAANEQDDSGYSFNFERDTEFWMPRGGLMHIERSTKFSYTGKSSLYVYDRAKTWHGPAVRIDKVKPGVNYAYSAFVMYNEKEREDTHTFLLELQYNYDGKENYSVVSRKELQKGNWSNLSGTFTLPMGATDIYLYIQTEDVNDEFATEDDLTPFYIDNITIVDSTLIDKQRRQKMIITAVIAAIAFAAAIIITIKLVKRSKATKEVLHAVSIDGMTGAYNRNTYEERFSYFEEHPDQCRKLYFTVCDVNFLKYINDNYGHEKGDGAIKRCASVLLKAVGKKGKVYRTGGDEFVCITDIDLTEKIRTEFSIEAQDYQGYPFSAAAGTASYDNELDGDEPDIKNILKRSDEEMYKNKQEVKKEFSEYVK